MDIFTYEFMRNAVIAGLLAAIACGIVGVYIVTRKIVFISGGIAHASFGGIGLGYLMGINPVIGATIFTILAAIGIGIIAHKTRFSLDTAIGFIWSTGMALGILFIALTPGYAPDLFSYLFGNILTVPFSDIIIMIILNCLIFIVVIMFYKEFLAISFDEEYSTVIGIPVFILNLIQLCLVALTTIILIRVVGIILVIALMTIPAALAREFSHNIGKMMLIAIIIGMVITFGGLLTSYFLDLPSGATIILFSAILLTIYYVSKLIRQRVSLSKSIPSA